MTVSNFLNFGIESAKRHFLKFMGLQAIAFAALGIGAGISIAAASALNEVGKILGGLLMAFLALSVSFGFLKNVLNLCRGEKIDFLAFVKVKPMTVLYFFASSLLCFIAICIGLILFVVPGLILSCMLFLVPVLVIDQDMNPIEAIKESIRQTKGHKMDIYLGFPVSVLASVFVSLSTINPIFFVIPMILFSYVYPYLRLTGQLEESKEEAKETPAKEEENKNTEAKKEDGIKKDNAKKEKTNRKQIKFEFKNPKKIIIAAVSIVCLLAAAFGAYLIIDSLDSAPPESSDSAAAQSSRPKPLEPVNVSDPEMYYIPVADKSGLYKYITLEGRNITNAKYIRASMFREERALVQNKDSAWGYIDKKGKSVACCYSQALSFKDGIAWVNKNGNILAINSNGKTVATLGRDIVSVWPFYDGLALFSKDGMQGYMDKTFGISSNGSFMDGNRFQENVASVMCDNGKYAYINKSMERITGCDFDEAKAFKNSVAIVRAGNSWGVIDGHGAYIFRNRDVEMLINDESLFKYKKKNGNWGWMDSKGKVAIKPIYEETMSFGDRDIAPAKQNGQWGYIDKSGKYVIEAKYDAAYPFFNNRAFVKFADGYFKTIDANGNVDLKTEYQKLDPSYWTLVNTGVLSEPRIMTAKPSFSCDKKPEEEAKIATGMICKSEKLMSMDSKISKLYANAKSSNYAALSQRAFIAERNKCGEVSCLEKLHEDKVKELENWK